MLESNVQQSRFDWDRVSGNLFEVPPAQSADQDKADFMLPVVLADAIRLRKKRDHEVGFVNI
jgi:hypothetical protein